MHSRAFNLAFFFGALAFLHGAPADAAYITITLEAVPIEAADVSAGVPSESPDDARTRIQDILQPNEVFGFENGSYKGGLGAGAPRVNGPSTAFGGAALLATAELAPDASAWRHLSPESSQHPLWMPSSIFRPPRI